MDWAGHVIAEECDAHDGMHVLSANLVLSPDSGWGIEPEQCPCGRRQPRLKQVPQELRVAFDVSALASATTCDVETPLMQR